MSSDSGLNEVKKKTKHHLTISFSRKFASKSFSSHEVGQELWICSMHFDALCRLLLLLLLECIFKSQLESLSRFCWSLRVSRSYQSSFGSDLRKEVPLRPYYFSPPFALQLDFNHKCVYLKGKNKKDRLIGKLTQGGKNSNKKSCTTRRRKAKLLLSCNCFLSVSRVAVGGALFLDHCHDVKINERPIFLSQLK